MSQNIESESGSAQQEAIGQRLREAREVLGLTQEDAAKALGLPRTSISSMEAGKRNVTGTELQKLGTLYRRSAGWILGDEPSANVAASALLRATRTLSDGDQEQVLRFAQFLAAAGAPPKPTHPS
jgi:transcriptional regulator with XRE-family HTH domain